MRSIKILAALAVLATAGTPALAAAAAPAATATTDEQAIGAVIAGVGESLNALDVPRFVGLHTDSPTILDEFAPFAWSGKDAVKTWLGDFGAWAKGAGVTSTHIAFGAPEAVNIAGDRAYATAPVTIIVTMKGTTVATLGQFAFLMVKQSGSWKIAGWAYTRTGTTM